MASSPIDPKNARPLKLKKKPLSKKEAEAFARATLELTLEPEMLARQAVLLGKQVKRELTDKEREELESIGRLAKTMEQERTEAWDILSKASE